jgi:hypothetical protein
MTHSEQIHYLGSSSEDEKPMRKVKIRSANSDDARSSVILSDSSFEEQMKVMDEDNVIQKTQPN